VQQQGPPPRPTNPPPGVQQGPPPRPTNPPPGVQQQGPPPRPTNPPPVKTEQQWLQEYEAKLDIAKQKLALVANTEGVDKTKLPGLNTLMREALAFKQGKHYQDAINKLDDFEREADAALHTKAAKQMLRANNAERSTFAKEAQVDMIVAELPPEIDFTAVRQIMDTHRGAVKNEMAVFDGVNDLQDVLEIKDENERTQKLQAIGDAMKAAKKREKDLIAELHKLPPVPPNATEDQKKAFRNAFSLVVGMCDHIPEEFLAMWTPNFEQRVQNLCLSPDDKRDKLDNLRTNGAFSDGDKLRHKAVFKQGIEPKSTKEFERHDSYFDQLIAPVDPNDLKEMYKVQDELIAKAREIRDCGGSLKDCEKVLEHIPKTWWPPEFVEELQAWRKTERLLARERVHEMFNEKKELLETSLGCVEFVLGSMAQLNDFREMGAYGQSAQQGLGKTDDLKGWLADNEVTATLGRFGDTVKTGFGNGRAWVEAAMAGDFSNLKDATPTQIAEFGAKILEAIGTCGKAVQAICKAKNFPIPSDSLMATSILPGIGIAVAGIDLALCLKNLAQHSTRAVQTRMMTKKAEMEWAMGEAEDGGAFVNALKNELGGRHRQIAKDSVDVTAKSLQLTGAIGEVTGIGTVAGFSIRIVGKTIEVGGKIVFTGIEWGLADRAKAMMREAQAGNPIARMQIFEDCNLYAKMYICVLVKEGNPLAKKFLEERSIEEGDLNDAMSLKILREAMLKDVDQKDETQVSDSLAEHMAESFTNQSVMKVGKAIVAKIAKIKDIGKDRKVAYDENWNYAGTIALTQTHWNEVKKQALAAGLFDEPSGIGEALGKIEKAEAAVGKAKPNEAKAKRVALLDALNAAHVSVRQCSPMTNPHGEEKTVCEHKGTVVYLVQLLNAIQDRINDVDLGPVTDPTTGTRDDTQGAGVSKACADWNPVAAASLEPADWKANFDDAVTQCHLSGGDAGIEAALKAVKKAIADPNYADTAQDVQKQRAARLAASEKYNALLAALNAFWTGCGQVDKLRTHLTQMIQLTATDLRELDRKTYGTGVNWVNPAAASDDAARFDATLWENTYKSAEQAGAILKGNNAGDVTKALKTAADKKTALDNTTDLKKKVTARKEYKQALTKVFVAASKFGSAQMIKGMADYIVSLTNEARKRMVTCEEEQNSVDFTPANNNLTANDFRTAYDKAVKEGAIEAHDGSAKKFEGALKKYLEDQGKLATQADWEKKRKTAAKIKGELAEVLQTLVELTNRYGDHKKFGPYLKALQVQASAPLRTQALDQILDGADPGQDFPPTAFVWTDKDWQKAKKVAIEKGLLNDSSTNFGASLTKAKKAFDEAKEEGDQAQSEKYARKKQKAVTALNLARGLAQAMMNSTRQANLRTYFDDAVKEADRMIGELQ
jgi:hypothetical protein